MIPATPPVWCVSKAERQLFEWLRTSKNTEGWIGMHSVRIQGQHRYKRMTELDFLLLTPLGLLVLEVKGGRVYKEGHRHWVYRDGLGRNTKKHEGPFEQAEGGLHALERWLGDHPDTSSLRSELLTGWGVVMPDMPTQSWGAGVSPDQVYDTSWRGQSVEDVVSTMMEVARASSRAQGRRVPSVEECLLVSKALVGDLEAIPKLELERRLISSQLTQSAEQSFEGLDTWGHHPRLMIQTPAGTGGIPFATEVFRRLSRKHEKVKILAPSGYLKRLEEALDHRLPTALACDALLILSAEGLSGEDIIHSFEHLDGGREEGHWVVLHDARNQAAPLEPSLASTLRELDAIAETQTLVHNIQHSSGITRFINGTCDPALRLTSHIEGPPPQLVPYSSEEEAAARIRETISNLVQNEGIPPEHILVLVCKKCQQETVRVLLDSEEMTGISVMPIEDAGGMASDVVVLTGVERLEPPEWKDLVYAGASCARALLIMHLTREAMFDYIQKATTVFAPRQKSRSTHG